MDFGADVLAQNQNQLGPWPIVGLLYFGGLTWSVETTLSFSPGSLRWLDLER